MAAALPGLTALVAEDSPLLRDEQILAALEPAARLLREVHRRGTAITLGAIADRTVSNDGAAFAEVGGFIRALAETAGPELVVGTLNYDGLLHATIIEALGKSKLSDLAQGYGEKRLRLYRNGPRLTGWPLRSATQALLPAPIQVLQLHGSLGWLRARHGEVYRFELQPLRDAEFWKHIQDTPDALEPCVILTNQVGKQYLAKTWPFADAYQRFFSHAAVADRWIIAGYGFADEEVNRQLRRALASRTPKPAILVVTYREHPTQQVIADELGKDVTVLRVGIAKAPDDPAWDAWAGS